jgi:hypothetical protein
LWTGPVIGHLSLATRSLWGSLLDGRWLRLQLRQRLGQGAKSNRQSVQGVQISSVHWGHATRRRSGLVVAAGILDKAEASKVQCLAFMGLWSFARLDYHLD